MIILKVDCAKGHVHDYSLFKSSKLKLNKSVRLLADLGYLGINKLLKNAIIPYKASKKQPLTDEQKKHNLKLSRDRIVVENKIRECKIFRIVKDVYRGKHKNYGMMWNLVAGLVNFKNSTAHFRYAN